MKTDICRYQDIKLLVGARIPRLLSKLSTAQVAIEILGSDEPMYRPLWPRQISISPRTSPYRRLPSASSLITVTWDTSAESAWCVQNFFFFYTSLHPFLFLFLSAMMTSFVIRLALSYLILSLPSSSSSSSSSNNPLTHIHVELN